jgi:hypothetical protein
VFLSNTVGHIDYKEVCIGILKIYDSLNAKFPAHVLAPKRCVCVVDALAEAWEAAGT